MALGAFGAHGLKSRLSPDALSLWQTAVQYHVWHVFALLAAGLAGFYFPGAWVKAAGWLFVAGMVIFSGSLYALALGAAKGLGALTPFGGLALILGWVALACAFIFARTPG